MPIPHLGRQLSCRVKDGDEIYRYELVYLNGEAAAEFEFPVGTDTNLVNWDRKTAFFEVGKMPVAEVSSEHSKHFGFAMINFPYLVPSDSVRVPDSWNLPLKDRTINTDYLKGMVTVMHRGITWAIVKVPSGHTTPAGGITINPADYVKAYDDSASGEEAAGGIEKFVIGTDAEEEKVGQALSNVYKEPARSSEQWSGNLVPTPTSGVNIGYVLVEINRP